MRADFAEKITELRLKGLGYKTIAIVLGISKDTVRYYCQTHGLNGNASLVKSSFPEHKQSPEVCKQCGAVIIRVPHSGKKLFCREECRRTYWRLHPQEAKRSKSATYKCECAYCRRIFYSYGNSKRKYCSHDCYINDRFWSDPNMTVDEREIRNRQRIVYKPPAEVTLKRIS